MLTKKQAWLKRGFDVITALVAIILLWWLILLAWAVASVETRGNGFFVQKRVGKGGRLFRVFKIKTMVPLAGIESSVTTAGDKRITVSGAFFRKMKIDELPQLVNILIGDMSVVGPRPDVPGYADRLTGDERIILTVRPGVTGPATLKYRNEEAILEGVEDPQHYNDTVIWPDKVAMNKEYIASWTFAEDLRIILKTVIG